MSVMIGIIFVCLCWWSCLFICYSWMMVTTIFWSRVVFPVRVSEPTQLYLDTGVLVPGYSSTKWNTRNAAPPAAPPVTAGPSFCRRELRRIALRAHAAATPRRKRCERWLEAGVAAAAAAAAHTPLL